MSYSAAPHGGGCVRTLSVLPLASEVVETTNRVAPDGIGPSQLGARDWWRSATMVTSHIPSGYVIAHGGLQFLTWRLTLPRWRFTVRSVWRRFDTHTWRFVPHVGGPGEQPTRWRCMFIDNNQ